MTFPALWIAATLMLRGTAPTLGSGFASCDTAIALIESVIIHARIVRLGWEDSTLTYPGGPFSVLFRFTAVDTYSVILWASNRIGAGCRSVFVRAATPGGTTDVPPSLRPRAPPDSAWYDLQGRRVRGPKPGSPAWRKPFDRRHHLVESY